MTTMGGGWPCVTKQNSESEIDVRPSSGFENNETEILYIMKTEV